MRNFITNTLFSLLMLLKKSFFLLLLTLATINTSAQTFEWAKHTASIDSSYKKTYDLEVDYDGNVITGGMFSSTVDFDTNTTYGTLTAGITNPYTYSAFIAKYDSLGNLIWIKQFDYTSSMNGTIYIASIDVDEMNNIYAVIHSNGQVDMDPGTGVSLTPNLNTPNISILKLNKNGDYIWGKTYNMINSPHDGEIKYSNGNLFITGELTNTFDFDFSNGTDILTPLAGSSSLFIHKIDTALNHEWVRKIDSISLPVTEIVIDNNNDILFPFSIAGNVTINMGNNSVNLNSTGINNGILKMTNTGNLLWAKMCNNLYISSITIDANNNFYTYGKLLSITADLDLGPSQQIVSYSPQGSEALSFVTKNSPNANLMWVKTFENTINPYSIKIDNNENLYLLGDAYNGFDADPNPTTHNLNYVLHPNGVGNITYLLQLNPQGDLGWAIYHPHQTLGTFDFDKNTKYIYHSFDARHNDLFGNYIDYDFSNDTLTLPINGLNPEMMIMKIGPDTCNSLSISIDSTYNIYCNQNGYLGAIAHNGTPPYSYSWNTSPVTNDSIAYPNSTSGLFTATVSDANNCSSDVSTIITGPSTQVGYDLQLNVVSGVFISGFTSTITIDAFNDGCVPVSGQFGIVLDTSVTYNFSSIAPNYILGDTLIWDFSNLVFGTNITPTINITTNVVPLGTQICFPTFITPDVADLDASNNYKDYCYNVVGSYDPNDKSLYPKGPCSINYIDGNEILTYTIRFQNTGNYPAQNVVIMDELDTNLDISTARVIGKSDNLILEALQDNTLKFRFDNIMLPDSTSDEPNSHGYVVFEIETFPNTPYGTQIDNNVGIYFDYNSPIITNTVSTIIVDSLQPLPPAYVIVRSQDSLLVPLEDNHTYQWYNGGGVIVINETSNFLLPSWDGTYTVEVIDSNNCIVKSSPYNYSLLALAPELEKIAKVYPNPFVDYTYLEFSTTQNNTIVELIDINGKVLKQFVVNGDKIRIERESLPAGIYFLQTTKGNNNKIIAR